MSIIRISHSRDDNLAAAVAAVAALAAVAAAAAAPAAAPAPKTATKERPAFDVQSEELFPALGSGPKPKTPVAATWGAKPSSVAAAAANGSGVHAGMLSLETG